MRIFSFFFICFQYVAIPIDFIKIFNLLLLLSLLLLMPEDIIFVYLFSVLTTIHLKQSFLLILKKLKNFNKP